MRPELEQFRQKLNQYALEFAHKKALHGNNSAFDYSQLLDELTSREKQLSKHAGKVFALALENSPEAVLWDLAALFSGLPCVVLPSFFTPAQRAHCMMQSQVELAIASADMNEEMLAAGFTAQNAFWARTRTADPGLPSNTAKITYTSGTTGAPKGVCLSAEALLRVARELQSASLGTNPQHYLAVLPYAVLLENLGVYAALMTGAEVTVLPQQQMGITGASMVDWQRLLGTVVMSQAQSLILVPQLLLGLVTAIERNLLNSAQFRFVAVGGARISTDLLERAHAVGLPVFQGYGLSECASVVSLNRPNANRLGSVGRPLPHVQVRLGDDGEVMVRGSALLGYLGEQPLQDDWLATGDIGEFDADGYLYLKGRKKHQFITSFGRNVNPDWVEAELTQQGTIAQAFVHGEGLSRNLALLWPLDPACSDKTLACAVEQANKALPEYAQVRAWTRLSEPFTPNNQLLTSNGRLRREAILTRYHDTLSELMTD